MDNIIAWWRHAQRIGAEGFLVSSWEPYRLAIELTTAIDAAAASLWLEPHVTDPREMLARGFERAFGKSKGRAAARVALACDAYPFSGYPRWEINARWDTASRREPLANYRAEERHFAKLALRAQREKLPAPLRASVEFRHYLAVRDVCVRQMSSAGFQPALMKSRQDAGTTLRKAIAGGLRAARTMWTRTRDPLVVSPNEQIVRNDADRLRALRRGEPVFGGPWQLCYKVWNFAPAVQLVGVEQQLPDGTWATRQACHTIEFQSRAARRRSDIVREHAAPIDWDGDLTRLPELRLFLRGVGQVKIGDVALVGADVTLPAEAFRGWRILGRRAPTAGMPSLDMASNADERNLSFRTTPSRRLSQPGKRRTGKVRLK
jgi:hypothetical protein